NHAADSHEFRPWRHRWEPAARREDVDHVRQQYPCLARENARGRVEVNKPIETAQIEGHRAANAGVAIGSAVTARDQALARHDRLGNVRSFADGDDASLVPWIAAPAGELCHCCRPVNTNDLSNRYLKQPMTPAPIDTLR